MTLLVTGISKTFSQKSYFQINQPTNVSFSANRIKTKTRVIPDFSRPLHWYSTFLTVALVVWPFRCGSQNVWFEIPETFRVKWKSFSCSGDEARFQFQTCNLIGKYQKHWRRKKSTKLFLHCHFFLILWTVFTRTLNKLYRVAEMILTLFRQKLLAVVVKRKLSRGQNYFESTVVRSSA